MTKEPVLTIASIQAVVAAVITALVAFDIWTPTADQKSAIFGLYAVLAPLAFGLWARGKVAPTSVPSAD